MKVVNQEQLCNLGNLITKGHISVSAQLEALSGAKEFEDIRLRVNEKKTLNALNTSKENAIRWVLSERWRVGIPLVDIWYIASALRFLPALGLPLPTDSWSYYLPALGSILPWQITLSTSSHSQLATPLINFTRFKQFNL